MTERVTHVTQGHFRVSDRPGELLCTVLGSCIAACLHDPVRRIGGMNHFLLPGADPSDLGNVKYGSHAMEQLINALLRAGADRGRLQARIYGGGNVVAGLGRIGGANAAFAREFMAYEGIALVADDTGGAVGRRVRFDPAAGTARVFPIDPAQVTERPDMTRPVAGPRAGRGVELF